MSDSERVIEFFGRHTKCDDPNCEDDLVAPHCTDCGENWPCETFLVKQIVARYMLFPAFSQETGKELPVCKSCGEPIVNDRFVYTPRGMCHEGYCAV